MFSIDFYSTEKRDGRTDKTEWLKLILLWLLYRPGPHEDHSLDASTTAPVSEFQTTSYTDSVDGKSVQVI